MKYFLRDMRHNQQVLDDTMRSDDKGFALSALHVVVVGVVLKGVSL